LIYVHARGFNLIPVLVVMAFAPLAAGVSSRLKQILPSKRGPAFSSRIGICRNLPTVGAGVI